MFISKLSRSLALGFLSLQGVTLAAVITPRSSSETVHAAIAVKLNSESQRRDQTQSGAELVETLVREALSTSQIRKRDQEDFTVLPLINSVSPEKISELVERAKQLTPTYKGADFGSWFQVVFDFEKEEGEDDVKEILGQLFGSGDVVSCQTLGGAPEPFVQPNDDPLFVDQGYLHSQGIQAEYAWAFPGGNGANTSVIDIERGWKLDHEDIVANGVSLLAGINWDNLDGSYFYHGLAVMGEMIMTDNTIGGVGAAPAADGNVVGAHRWNSLGHLILNQPEAIMDAITFLDHGDILLLEFQEWDAAGWYWPPEILDAEFDAISLATSLGITVIETAGNGVSQGEWAGTDLDTEVIRIGETTGHYFLNKAHADFRDSGAIIAAASTPTSPGFPAAFSNFGSRIDAHAWGQGVITSTCFKDQSTGVHTDAYGIFGGTSASAPIVAGAALSIQGMVFANQGIKLNAYEMRDMIVIGGSPSANPTTDRIGVQPNLRYLIDNGYLV